VGLILAADDEYPMTKRTLPHKALWNRDCGRSRAGLSRIHRLRVGVEARHRNVFL